MPLALQTQTVVEPPRHTTIKVTARNQVSMIHFVPMRKRPEEPPPHPRRPAMIGFVVIVLLVIVGLFLTHVLRDMSRVQDCVMQGRTNCAPVDPRSNR
jgi:hypothetical protein